MTGLDAWDAAIVARPRRHDIVQLTQPARRPAPRGASLVQVHHARAPARGSVAGIPGRDRALLVPDAPPGAPVPPFLPTVAAGLAFAFSAATASAQPAATAADSAAIRALVLDYALGWYDGEPARMERALHPRLAKRSVARDAAGRATLAEMPPQRLIDEARAGVGRAIPADVRRVEVRILDVYGDIASVRGDMHGWVDYFQVARLDGEWKVVNVLWALRPEQGGAQRRARPATPAPAGRP